MPVRRSLSWVIAVIATASACGQTQYVLQTPSYPNGSDWQESELYSPYNSYSGDDIYYPDGAYVGGAGGAGWTGSCSGQGTWRWSWGGAGVPPLNVIIQVNSSASWSAAKSDGSGACDDGYQDPVTPVGTPKTIGGITGGTHYII